MSQTTSPLQGMPVLDVPFPHPIPAATSSSESTSTARQERAEPRAPALGMPSAQKTVLGVAPTSDDLDTPANRPTLPDAPMGRPRPGRTIVGVGPYGIDGQPREVVDAIDDPNDAPEIVTEPARIDVARLEAASAEAPTFEPSAYARDPGLGPAESIRLPRRRIEAGDWLLLAIIIALVAGVFAALF